MPLHFVAYPAADRIHAETIAAAKAATTTDVTDQTWPEHDRSGAPLGESVESWIDDAEAVVADRSDRCRSCWRSPPTRHRRPARSLSTRPVQMVRRLSVGERHHFRQ